MSPASQPKERTYLRNAAMVTGGPFHCHNCNKKMVANISGGPYELKLVCPRCKAENIVIVKEPIPFVIDELEKQKKADKKNG